MLEIILHIIGFCPDTLGHFDLLDILNIIVLNWTDYETWFNVYIRRV